MNELTIRKPPGAIRLPDNDQWTDRFEVKSETSNRVYIIARNKKSGKWACSCPGWKIHRRCKHLLEGCGLTLAQIHGNTLPDQRPKTLKLKYGK